MIRHHTVVAIFMDMQQNRIVDIVALTNPQSALLGQIVISRMILPWKLGKTLALLQEKIIDC